MLNKWFFIPSLARYGGTPSPMSWPPDSELTTCKTKKNAGSFSVLCGSSQLLEWKLQSGGKGNIAGYWDHTCSLSSMVEPMLSWHSLQEPELPQCCEQRKEQNFVRLRYQMLNLEFLDHLGVLIIGILNMTSLPSNQQMEELNLRSLEIATR